VAHYTEQSLSLPGIKPQFPSHSTHSVVTIPTDLSRQFTNLARTVQWIVCRQFSASHLSQILFGVDENQFGRHMYTILVKVAAVAE
jgi:hypothetical protein